MCDYDMMTNEELVVLVVRRDSRAFEMLEHRFSKFVLFKARRLNKVEGLDRDDILQEARICLYKACTTFDPERGFRFMTYFGTLLENHYNKIYYRSIRKSDPLNGYLEFCEEIGEQDTAVVPARRAEGPDGPAVRNETHEALMESIREDLTDMERRVVLSYLAGGDYRLIAGSLGIDEKAVDNALTRAKKKLRLSMAAYR
ncbi:MAG: sigma-70 family RNA polymerase sigma factor [Eubacteriaceae bacterium]|nr:sigma-70 family RNA polymerase sigma factor [Eubacteriaceae bacterium]